MATANTLKKLGGRLASCRLQAQFDVRGLAALASVEPSRIEAFEDGTAGLEISQAIRLARALGVPRETFLNPAAAEPRAFPEPAVMLLSRGTASLSEKDQESLTDALKRARMFLEAIEVTEPPPLAQHEELFRTTKPVPAGSYSEGYDRARAVRRCLAERLPARAPEAAPLRDLRRLLEDYLGILVVNVQFATPDVDEASCRLGPARVIAVDPGRTEATRRWALAHGLAHQLLDLAEADALVDASGEGFSLEKSSAERRADAFAAMLLAPEAAVNAVLSGRPTVNLADARKVAEDCGRVLGVNFVPMVRHLQNLKKISLETAEVLVLSGNKAGTEGLEVEGRHDGLERRVFQALAGGWISRGRGRELLGLSPDDDDQLDGALRGCGPSARPATRDPGESHF
jgi:Zn-dependent peptidase ImmA (M78 family)